MLGRSPEIFDQHDLTIELPASNGELLDSRLKPSLEKEIEKAKQKLAAR